ncbi:hypothetical protein Mtc_0575 [Methanocella conradii HZ254]|uniref:DUF2225 domain-containing protein n=1 Tax=Methanocella conradii (strain DSM 24694 / JCM 17849 / CGMCC 1.5162 / HZ254) TaxID=1041930 RepID=H8I5M1_METCZ|nr:DUF2225 domain-containing protein [Methanocella conradii]AFC99340.1 hypothetical protein Mtc_0575 [Methanocella conradii HZ254]MDI6896879.1 DUF2225 domain-containing protein [Methanocella conradii]
MTTIQPVRLTCPLCGNIFESPVVMSTNSFGKLHSDLYKEAAGGAQPICYFVHTCPSCGYTGYEGDFEKQEFSFVFRQNVEQNITPEVKGRKVEASGKFYLAALCAEWRGAPAHVLARIYHMGAWCCRLSGQKEKERFYLGKAAEYFERALASSDAPEENIPIFTYLLGDLYRRLGEAEKAKEWYSKVEQAIKEHGGDPRIGELARRQLKEPSDFLS